MLFFWTKGVVALIAVGLLVFHMRAVKRQHITLGRWLRYQCLLYFAVLLAGASIDQLAHEAAITWYGVGGLIGACLVVFAAGVSIAEEHNK